MRTYMLFLDFSSAYNTVLHQELFRMLGEKSILTKGEIQLLRAIYARNTIELGAESFKPNVGVAQGSIISPYLFNIYSEELLLSLEQEGWRTQELYGFADDHLILNGTPRQLKMAIRLIKKWCDKFNITLNPSKSGIMEVPPKYKKAALEVGSSVDGIPVVDSYKYLGVWLDQRLSPQRHIDYLFGVKKKEKGKKGCKGKISFLVGALGQCFRNISFDYKANLWITFIRPLFLPLATLATIMTKSEKELVETKLRVSLRKFLGLPKHFRSDILLQVFPIDFCIWMEVENENNQLKWEARRLRTELEVSKHYKIDMNRHLPGAFGALLKSFTSICKVCRVPFYPEHLEEHGLKGVRIEEIYAELDRIKQNLEGPAELENTDEKKKKVRRAELMEAYKSYIETIQKDVNHVLIEYAEVFREE